MWKDRNVFIHLLFGYCINGTHTKCYSDEYQKKNIIDFYRFLIFLLVYSNRSMDLISLCCEESFFLFSHCDWKKKEKKLMKIFCHNRYAHHVDRRRKSLSTEWIICSRIRWHLKPKQADNLSFIHLNMRTCL